MEDIPSTMFVLSWIYLIRTGEEHRLSRFLRELERSSERRFDILASANQIVLLPSPDIQACLPAFHKPFPNTRKATAGRPGQHIVVYCFDIHCIPISGSSLGSASIPKTPTSSSFMSLHNFRSEIILATYHSSSQSASSKYLLCGDLGGKGKTAQAAAIFTEKRSRCYQRWHWSIQRSALKLLLEGKLYLWDDDRRFMSKNTTCPVLVKHKRWQSPERADLLNFSLHEMEEAEHNTESYTRPSKMTNLWGFAKRY